jgi:hypothetical protein
MLSFVFVLSETKIRLEQRGSQLSVMRCNSFPARAACGACSENDCLSYRRTESQPFHQKFGNYPSDDLCGIGVYPREGMRERERESKERECVS